MVSVTNAHGNVQIQNPGLRSAAYAAGNGGDFTPATREGFSSRSLFATDLPDRAAPAQVDPGPARTAGPFPGLGLAGGVAPGTRRAVDLPGRRSSGEQFGSGAGVSSGPAPREGPYVDVQLRRTGAAPTLLLLLFLLRLIPFLFRVLVLLALLLALPENVPPPLGRGERRRRGRIGYGRGGTGLRIRRLGGRVFRVGTRGFFGRVGFGVEGEEVEWEEDAVDEELVGGEEVGLGERGVSDHPELEFGGIAVAASSSA